MPASLQIDSNRIAAFCAKWGVRELSLFGSALREDFRPESDVDLLVTFRADVGRTLFDLSRMSDELADIFGRPVDLHTRAGVEQSRNPIRKQAILSTARVIHAA